MTHSRVRQDKLAEGDQARLSAPSGGPSLTISEERPIKLGAPSPDARFKGYTSFVVQELVLHSHVIDFRCERWLTADGKVITAPLPEGFGGHFGPHCAAYLAEVSRPSRRKAKAA